MISIQYEGLLERINEGDLKDKFEKIQKASLPDFEKEKADLDAIIETAEKYTGYKNIILIGNGGSRNSAYALYHSLENYRNDVNFEFISSVDPAPIANLQRKYSKEDTLVIVVSKSGTNINALEPTLLFIEYPILVVVQTGRESVLHEVAKRRGWDVIHHPPVGGRFSGMTTCALIPAVLMGLDIKALYHGAQEGYKKFSYAVDIENNDALKLAALCYKLDQKGYEEIFTSVYSEYLYTFLPLVVQLIHETTGKNDQGQTIYGGQGPETHHHTNQRFLGGRKNVLGMFWGVKETHSDVVLDIPDDLQDIEYRDQAIAALQGLSASKAVEYDREGVIENCRQKKIPCVEIMIDTVTPDAIGEFMVFWQYFAVYSALLRDQDPFDQPEVELAKQISYDLRINRK